MAAMRKILGLSMLISVAVSICVPKVAAAETAVPIINEVQCHGNDWIELKNPSLNRFELSGWGLTDKKLGNASGAHLYVFPNGTYIEPKGNLIIEQKGVGEQKLPFGFPCAGGQSVSLLRPVVPGPFELVSRIPIPKIPKHTTYGRIPDVTGSFQFTTSTKGKKNISALPKYLGNKNLKCQIKKECKFSLSGMNVSKFKLGKKSTSVVLATSGLLKFNPHSRGSFLIPIKLINLIGQTDVLIKVRVS